MVSDQEPRYRLVDDEGNIVGSLYGKPDGTLALQEGTSGADNEATLGTDGTLSAPSVETELVIAEEASVTNAPSTDDDSLRWQEGAEVGIVQSDGVDNSGGDDNWGQSEDTVVSETFSSAFNSTPTVAIGESRQRSNIFIHEWTAWTNNPSTTGFDVEFHQVSGDDRTGVTDAYGIEYIATEGR